MADNRPTSGQPFSFQQPGLLIYLRQQIERLKTFVEKNVLQLAVEQKARLTLATATVEWAGASQFSNAVSVPVPSTPLIGGISLTAFWNGVFSFYPEIVTATPKEITVRGLSPTGVPAAGSKGSIYAQIITS